MSEIQSFDFKRSDLPKIREANFGKNWPVVYLLENGKDLYIGETVSAYSRTKQHLDDPRRAKLNRMHLIADDEFNKSATLDIESWLIQYMSAEGTFTLQNGNGGLKNHNYFDREKYLAKFERTWEKLKEMSLVRQDLVQLRNSDVFKYSPYKSLSDDQLIVVKDLVKKIRQEIPQSYIINGKPGTGKTILAIYLMKYLSEQEETKHLKIGLVVPMTPLRSTLKRVFRKVPGLRANHVMGPAEVVNGTYDLLIVDEAHRLRRRVNIPNYGSFDDVNNRLELGTEGTELDWILLSSKQQIFFYDRNQSVRPTDIPEASFTKLGSNYYNLATQMRVEGGEEYIEFINNLLDLRPVTYSSKGYDFAVFEDVRKMVDAIKTKDTECGLARIIAGYAWDWRTNNGHATYDIEIGDVKLVWNSTTKDWVNSPNAVNEVGCIHTIQGYDLNYAGVIIGPEISYDPEQKKIVIDPRKYRDRNGRVGVEDMAELERYIINIYKTLLTRGIKGTYVYVSDPELRKLFQQAIKAS